jgi:hypothetical protein
MRIAAALIVLWFSIGPLLAETKATDDSVAHGTINIVLGNENGIVVLTDSRITLGNGNLSPDPAQKLFKLDDRSVCTFAGFAYAPGSGDFFYTSTSAIIQEFSRQLSLTTQPISLEEKTHALSYILARQLTVLATLRDATKQATDPLGYSVQLTVVGYDIDGSPKIVQVTLRNTASMQHVAGALTDLWEEVPFPSAVIEVGKPLVPRLAGIRYIADSILDDPRKLESEPAIRKYADAKGMDGGQSLTITDMKDLAVQLALQTSKKERGVGGANQVAILQKGRVVSVEQATYPIPPKLLLDFVFTLSSLYEYQVGPFFNSDSPFPSVGAVTRNQLFVKCFFSGVRINLDNNYFSGDLLHNSIVVYDGSEAMHFGKNDVRNCILVIGPHAKRDTERVKHLVHDFTWLQVVYQEPKT